MSFSDVPWKEIFWPSGSMLEIVIRGSMTYLFIFAVLRLLLRRQPGALAISDLLVIVLVADAAQNGMAGDYTTVTESAVLVLTLAFWDFALDWLGFHSSRINRLVSRPSVVLVRNGRPVGRALDRELVTREELMSALRQRGVWDISQVEEARMEGNGGISVNPMDERNPGQ